MGPCSPQSGQEIRVCGNICQHVYCCRQLPAWRVTTHSPCFLEALQKCPPGIPKLWARSSCAGHWQSFGSLGGISLGVLSRAISGCVKLGKLKGQSWLLPPLEIHSKWSSFSSLIRPFSLQDKGAGRSVTRSMRIFYKIHMCRCRGFGHGSFSAKN